ncbi:hypothetical protein D0911_18355 [Zhongshania marina]|jgi:flagellar biogenesis protein FliO|uniref:Uncharacterized protein n=1 Tax=Zhongshania marina TaxID=2304603 RepID=A0A2S4HBH3_9GAMM|nr:hypothetical protein [Marortus luteolus]POP51334.1 hypothetical protein C0068_16960 [Marortus luteolus]RNL58012.1 hypothetical protein D0911_18355 [Zhongshania marina]
MGNLLTILAFLFIALIVLVPVIEKFAPRPSPEQQAKISRWILPLVGLSLILALFKSFMS